MRARLGHLMREALEALSGTQWHSVALKRHSMGSRFGHLCARLGRLELRLKLRLPRP